MNIIFLTIILIKNHNKCTRYPILNDPNVKSFIFEIIVEKTVKFWADQTQNPYSIQEIRSKYSEKLGLKIGDL